MTRRQWLGLCIQKEARPWEKLSAGKPLYSGSNAHGGIQSTSVKVMGGTPDLDDDSKTLQVLKGPKVMTVVISICKKQTTPPQENKKQQQQQRRKRKQLQPGLPPLSQKLSMAKLSPLPCTRVYWSNPLIFQLRQLGLE